MINAVFDTNVLLQAALNDTGPAYACWEFVEAGSVKVWITEIAFSELEEVMSRDKLRRKLTSVRPDRIETILDTFRRNTSVVATPANHFALERDADDEIFINLAIETKSDFLVSRDRDLLELKSNVDFVSKYPYLKVVNPVAFLEILRDQK